MFQVGVDSWWVPDCIHRMFACIIAGCVCIIVWVDLQFTSDIHDIFAIVAFQFLFNLNFLPTLNKQRAALS